MSASVAHVVLGKAISYCVIVTCINYLVHNNQFLLHTRDIRDNVRT